MLNFFLLTLFTIWLVLLLIGNKDKNKIGFLYSLVILIIFYTPNLYFILGGEAYRFFNEDSLESYIVYSCFVLLIYNVIYMMVYGFKIGLISSEIHFRSTLFVKLYFSVLLFSITLYYVYFFNSLPLVHFLLEGELIDRPDLTGDIPFFFTVSTIAFVILPSAYFFYFESFKRIPHLLVNILIIFVFIASGNKGLIVFYFLFLWLYVFNTKLDFRILFLFILSFGIYLLTKGITEINYEVMEYLMTSPFRRFFVTQGTCFLYRLDMVVDGYTYLQADPRGIKFDVFLKMYNTDVIGSCPTFVTGDFLVKYGSTISLMLFTVISSVILLVSKVVTLAPCKKKLFLYWNIYFVLYVIVMSGLGMSNIYRILFVVCSLAVIYFLGRIRVGKYE